MALGKDVEYVVQAQQRAEEAERVARAELERVLTTKHELEAALQQDQEAFRVLRTDLKGSRDRRAVIQ